MDFVTINPPPKSSNVDTGGQFKKTVFFLNHSGLDIKVNYPNGEHITIPTIVEAVPRRIFEIHVEYEINLGCSLHTLREALGEKEFELVEREMATNRREVRLKYEVSDISEIESGKGLYVESLAMALTSANVVGTHYPTGVEGAVNSNSFDLKVVIVDHSGLIDGYYVSFLDYVFEAKHSSGTGLGDGIYLMSTFCGESTVKKYDLMPEAGPIRVFRSLAVAKAYEGEGALSERLQFEKEALALDKVKLEGVLASERAEMEREKNRQELEHRNKINQLEEDKKRLEHRYRHIEHQRKDFYEARSHVRKDTSETTKWLPAIAAAVGMFFGLIA